MTRNKLIIAGVLGLSVLAAGAVVAGDGFGHHQRCGMPRHAVPMPDERDMGGRVMRFLDRLDLTQAQRTQVLDILDAQQNAAQKARRSMYENRIAFREAMTADEWDEAKVRDLANTQAKEMAEMMVARADAMHRIRGVLNDDQRKMLDEVRKYRRGGEFIQE